MKILYVTDLHGNEWKYEKTLEVALREKVSLVINGGDMLPFLDSLKKVYPDDFITEYLTDHFHQFDRAKIPYLCFLCNDDLRIYDSIFDSVCSDFEHVKNIAQRKVEFLGHEFIGMNLVNDYPFRLKDRCRLDSKKDHACARQFGTALLSDTNSTDRGNPFITIKDYNAYLKTILTIKDELDKLPTPRDPKKCFYVIHVPPYGLGLDVCGDGREVGSYSVRDFLQLGQPAFALHGHIHESPRVSGKWYAQLGETLCIQPGQYPMQPPKKKEFLDYYLTYVLIDLEEQTIERVDEPECQAKASIFKYASR